VTSPAERPFGALWARFELSPPEARRVASRQAAWIAAQAVTAGGLALTGLDADPVLALAIATGVGVIATRPARVYLLPLVLLFVVATTLLLNGIGVSGAVAAGAAAGLAVGTGSTLARLEAVLTGVAGAGVGMWAADRFGLIGTSPLLAVGTGGLVAACAAQALLPGALHWTIPTRLPSPGRIQATLAAPYRAACMRAWQLDQSFDGTAPDRATRVGLAEVAAWVYRLALTLQTLDADLARIDPIAIRARRDGLLVGDAVANDAFIRERREGTAVHLARMLEHHDALVLERARTESLQDYALAYLEEARAGIAVARVLPGEQTPESLGVVLEKLRAHTAESGARRQTAREIDLRG
jgi:hypothetical protein